MPNPFVARNTTLNEFKGQVRTLPEAIAEYERIQARWKAAWTNYDAVFEADASPRHVEKVYALLVELAGLSRQFDVARRDVLVRLLRLKRRKRFLRRVAWILLVASLSAGATLLTHGCWSLSAG